MGISLADYQTAVLGVLPYIKDNIIAPIAPASAVETRYLTSEGRNDERWLSYLTDTDGVVDIWMLTLMRLRGLSSEDERQGSVGTFTKPVEVVIDYYADYRHGLDAIGAVGSETVTNTEREFLKKIIGVDLALENKKGCLTGNILIRDWDFQLKLRRFDNATVHWASGVINLEFSELFLN